MICERSVVIFTWALLSSLTSYSSVWATESKVSEPSKISAQISTQITVQSNDQQNKNISDQQHLITVTPSNAQKQQEQTEAISKTWSLVGIGFTSLLFLLVIRLLFQPEKQNLAATVTQIEGVEEHYGVEEVDEITEVIHQGKTRPPEPLPMIGMEYTDEVIPQYTKTEAEIARDATNEITISEPVDQPARKPILPPTDQPSTLPQQQLAAPLKNRSPVPAKINNKVTIMTAKTTKIDLVFELIQDLQQSDRSLRRKAIWKLAQSGDFRAIEPLLAIMPQANSADKSLILDAITKIAQRNWQPIYKAIFISLADDNAQVKKKAIIDATILAKSLFPLNQRLTQMLTDSDREVQQTAKWALQQLQQQLPVPSPQNSPAHHHSNQALIVEQRTPNQS